MKFKLSNGEMIALIMLFNNIIDDIKKSIEAYNPSTEIEARSLAILFLASFEELHINLQQKALLKKEKYTIKLSPCYAVIFWMYFNGLTKQNTHTGNMVQTMCNAIHQQIICK